jgi:chaperone modulatory protein CbpM
MGTDIVTVMTGTVVDDERGIPLATLCRACGLPVEAVAALVDEGILEPAGARRGRWRFPADSIRRARIALRLQRDLDLNIAGAALALDLLDHLEELRARVRSMEARRQHRPKSPNDAK